MEKGLIYSDQLSMFGNRDIIGYSNGNIYVKEMNKNESNNIIIKNHYSHKVAGFATTYIYLAVYMNDIDNILGTLQFGFSMNPASAKNIVSGTGIYEHLELNRMWIDDIAGKNSESQAISCAIKYIKHKHPKIKWIQSFADERCGCFGIVYQACSFNYYGEHNNIFWYLDGIAYHNIGMTLSQDSERYKRNQGGARYLQENKDRAERVELRQFRYIKFLDKSWKKKCLLKEMPYPKYYNENKK
jgi:adenine modification enzyme